MYMYMCMYMYVHMYMFMYKYMYMYIVINIASCSNTHDLLRGRRTHKLVAVGFSAVGVAGVVFYVAGVVFARRHQEWVCRAKACGMYVCMHCMCICICICLCICICMYIDRCEYIHTYMHTYIS